MWVAPVVVASIVVGALLWSHLPPPVEDLNGQARIITVRNESFWGASASLTWCTHEGDMPYQSFGLAGFTFTMHHVSCYAPSGGSVKGEAVGPGGRWSFYIGSRQLPDADGLKLWISPDQEVGVGYFGQNLTVLVRA